MINISCKKGKKIIVEIGDCIPFAGTNVHIYIIYIIVEICPFY